MFTSASSIWPQRFYQFPQCIVCSVLFVAYLTVCSYTSPSLLNSINICSCNNQISLRGQVKFHIISQSQSARSRFHTVPLSDVASCALALTADVVTQASITTRALLRAINSKWSKWTRLCTDGALRRKIYIYCTHQQCKKQVSEIQFWEKWTTCN